MKKKTKILTRVMAISCSVAILICNCSSVGAAFKVNKQLNVPNFKQEKNYWCGPASVKQVLHFINGSSKAQSVYAKQLGTTTSGTDMTKIPKVINNNNKKFDYGYYGNIKNYSEWETHVANAIKREWPAIIDINTSNMSKEWGYSTKGHYVVVSGFNNTGKTGYAYITDPHPKYHAKGKRYKSSVVYKANMAHFRKAVIV